MQQLWPSRFSRLLAVAFATLLLSCSIFAALDSYYTFDNLESGAFENTSFINDDSAVNGNHQLFVNGNPMLAPGVIGNALFFQTPPDYAAFSSFSDNDGFLTGVSGITISGWIYVNTLPFDQMRRPQTNRA